MFKWLGQRAGKKKQKPEQLREDEFGDVKEGLGAEQVVSIINNMIAQHSTLQQDSADSLRSLLKTVVADAEEMAASIKLRAQAEAEGEAAKIIDLARQEDQEIKKRAEIAAQKERENIISVANEQAEVIEAEAKQRAILFLLMAREEIEKEVREEYKRAYSRLSSSLQNFLSEGQNIEVELQDKRMQLWESKSFELKGPEAALLKTSGEVVPPPEALAAEEEEQIAQSQEEAEGEKIEQPAQLQEETSEEEQTFQVQEEAEGEKIEQSAQLQEETSEEEQTVQVQEEAGSAQLRPEDSQTLYTGEVELAIAMPVELKMVSKLYNYLQTIPDIKILRTTGSWDRGTTITVVADKPVPLISRISAIPDVEVTPELLQGDNLAKGVSSSLRKAGAKGAKRIKLTLKEARSI